MTVALAIRDSGGLPRGRLSGSAAAEGSPGRPPPAWMRPAGGDDALPIREVARLLGVSSSQVASRCRGEWRAKGLAWLQSPPGGRGRPSWWVNHTADPRLSDCPDRTSRDLIADLGKYPQKAVERGQERLRWVHRYLDLCPELGEKAAAQRAVWEAQQATPEPSISPSSLRRWTKRWRQGGLTALVDKYRPANGTKRTPEAVAFFYVLYRNEKRWSVRLCHQHVLDESRRKGWHWPSSPRATQRWLAKRDDLATTFLMRWGYKEWAHRFRPFIEQDYSSLTPGQMYVADSHECKFFVRDERGKPVRPWLVAIEDLATRCIVGWHLELAANQDTILLALRRAFLDWGVPSELKLDNGKDYSARLFHGWTKKECRELRRLYGKDWRKVLRHARQRVDCDRPVWGGLLPELGIRVIFAHPYEPQAKAIERWFRTMTDRFSCTLPGFCDTSPERRTEGLDVRIEQHADELLTLHQARERFGLHIAEYHDTPHQSLGRQTPLSRWTDTPKTVHMAQEGALDLMLQVRGLRTVRANGVEVSFGQPYRYGQYDPALKRWKGRKVLVACDPQDAGFVLCLDPASRRLICRAPSNRRLPPNIAGEELREASRQLGRAKRDAKRAQASAATRQKTAERIAAEAANRRALAATGTDDARPHDDNTTLAPVRTGFERASTALSTVSAARAQLASDESKSASYQLADLLAPEPEIVNTESAPSWSDRDLIRRKDFETELEES